MLNKNLMLNHSGSKNYTVTMKSKNYAGYDFYVESEILPEGNFRNCQSSYLKNGYVNFIQTSLFVEKELPDDYLRITRLDTGRSLILHKQKPLENCQYTISSATDLSAALFNLSDVGKTIQITIDLLGGA